MACTGLRPSFRRLLRQAAQTREISSFLVPALSQRSFSTSISRSSRIGKEPITIPPEVSLQFIELPRSNARTRKIDAATSVVAIKGPLGELRVNLPPYVTTSLVDSDRKISVKVSDPEVKHQHAMWGTTRAHIANSIAGVSEGHICILRMVGVGYRATIEETATTVDPEYEGQKFVNLKLGFAHPVELGIPKGVKATVPQPTRILLEGCDKQVVTQFAAEIREWRKPEPYKGKGIFVNDETIKLKAKKIK
ncbi:uncharacterized protein HMPREF1541_05542 [Cyphellophora europaea CBS 101466]|uniref:Large ribosomal subunit protein uL6m n=1 Tax=Cyphellophora europaea (strain CBS 101466) TaxID=1220924 RepID=W2RUC5_CYPE1|nr:uncharacterized protein HMPREF1541_05542 [Cyphellophora europaea CBS 101466]ETN39319.1 hypothetical protein HMPREF1541_05542 [Cyphellophora europaea CBS 101466]